MVAKFANFQVYNAIEVHLFRKFEFLDGTKCVKVVINMR